MAQTRFTCTLTKADKPACVSGDVVNNDFYG